jgi:hypothetical protein
MSDPRRVRIQGECNEQAKQDAGVARRLRPAWYYINMGASLEEHPRIQFGVKVNKRVSIRCFEPHELTEI